MKISVVTIKTRNQKGTGTNNEERTTVAAVSILKVQEVEMKYSKRTENAPAEYIPFSGKKKLALKAWRQRYLFLMMLPALICVILFSYIPMTGLYISLLIMYREERGLLSGYDGRRFYRAGLVYVFFLD